MSRIRWGDEHVQKSNVVIPFWQLVALVAMNGFQWGAIIALVMSR